jgi:hypothetical protein
MDDLIKKIMSYPVYDDSLALFYDKYPEPYWRVEFCNRAAHCVNLGEATGDYIAEGKTIEEAFENLIKVLDAALKESNSDHTA